MIERAELTLYHVNATISPLDMNAPGSVEEMSRLLSAINPNVDSWGYDFERDSLTITFAEGYVAEGDFSTTGDVNP